jgi:hypothetical protein
MPGMREPLLRVRCGTDAGSMGSVASGADVGVEELMVLVKGDSGDTDILLAAAREWNDSI